MALEKLVKNVDEIRDRSAKGRCISCAHPFSTENVFTAAGWRETQISHMCEKCFDALFEDEED